LKIKSIKEISLIAHSKSTLKEKEKGGNKKKLSSLKLPTTNHN
jgi:hypothetical protein